MKYEVKAVETIDVQFEEDINKEVKNESENVKKSR